MWIFKEKDSRIDQLTKENENLNSDLTKSRQQLEIVTDERNKLAARNEVLKKQHDEHVARIQKLEMDIDGDQETFDKLMKELKIAKKRNSTWLKSWR